ncbi:MAG: septal ring lytic transglycosylase RlpA family protein [Spirochaetes bacterium]|nr:septal ring lytic transglycosylase RlpA family protein [Spirochaetota bacterium]MBN2769107.1 septal ring lytic transglycosylase RlpA family protein [Spirochaetota bacterium]
MRVYGVLSKVFLVIIMLVFSAGCAQSKNMTRNDTVVEDMPYDSDSEDVSFSGDGLDDIGSGDGGLDDGYITAAGAGGGGADFDQTGNASWYGRAFHGRKTASGESFDMYEMSAAHKSYPFGTVLEVKNLDNGKSVQVRVNDRGPYVDGRIIDVSYAAGRDLGMLTTGTARVGLKVVSSPGAAPVSGGVPIDDSYGYGSPDAGAPVSTGAYSLQCGAFYSKKNADNLRDKLSGMFENRIEVIHEDDLYKVRILDIPSKEEANRFKSILSGEKIPGYLIKN